MRKLLTFTFLLFVTGTLFAQDLRYRVNFKGFFDNLENSSQFEPTRTYGGVSLQPEIGMKFGNNSIMGGVGITQTFGGETKLDLNDVLLYYQYEKNEFNFLFGNFSYDYGYDYPKLFFSEETLFHDQACSGVMLQYNGENGFAELAVDWMLQLNETRDDQFNVMATGGRSWGGFELGASAMLVHNKFAIDDIYLSEAIFEDLHASYDFAELGGCFDVLKLSAGMLGSQQNLRYDDTENNTGWDKSFGFFAEATLQWKGFGVRNNFYVGNALMPYYGNVGNELYWGSPFYQAKRYNRLDVYWTWEKGFVAIDAMFSAHFTPQQKATQQLIHIGVNIDKVVKLCKRR